MSFPDSVQCPITMNNQKIVYRNQNKDAFLDFIRKELDDFRQNIKIHKFYAIHTDRSLTKFGFDNLYVIEIAPCLRRYQNIFRYQIDTAQKQLLNLEEGYIIIDPDNDIINALNELFKPKRIHPILFDLVREHSALASIGINFKEKIGASFFSNLTLEDAISNNLFKCLENIDAIKDIPKYDLAKLIYECQEKSEQEIMDTYIELIPYYATRTAIVVLSLFHEIFDLVDYSRSHDQLEFKVDLYMEKNSVLNGNGALLFKELGSERNIYLENPKEHPYDSWLYINDLTKQFDEISKVKPDFKYSIQDLQNFNQICLAEITSITASTPISPLSRQLDLYKITGQLREAFEDIYNGEDKANIPQGKELEYLIEKENNPLLMISIESISKIPNKKVRDEYFQKVYDSL